MNRKLVLILTTFVLAGALVFAFKVKRAETTTESQSIHIRADGSIDPPTALIQRDGDKYILTDNITVPAFIYNALTIERDNIILDGAGFTIECVGYPPADSFPPRFAASPAGVFLSGRSNVTIKNLKTRTSFAGIELHESSNNTIVENTIESSSINPTTWRGSIRLYSGSSHINVSNNIVGSIVVEGSNYNIFSENYVTEEYTCLSESSYNTISGNNFSAYGLYVSFSYGNVVRDNFVAGKPLVYLENVSNYLVEDAGQVILVDCNNIQVENLTFSSLAVCVELWRTNNTIVARNNMTRNWLVGVWLWYSQNNSIVDNKIDGYGGIRIWSSSNNSIIGNNVTANGWIGGIRLEDSSSGNKIYHNAFMDNTARIYTTPDAGANAWDDGYPSGGNYWSDYDGWDANGDGIGETPYIIDAGNIDNYPLTNPEQSFPKLVGEYDKLLGELDSTRNLLFIFIAATAILAGLTVFLAVERRKLNQRVHFDSERN
jgi:parallel beta-helix repeat protein